MENQPQQPQPMPTATAVKTIRFENQNNKLFCDYFTHIAAAPPNPVNLPIHVYIENIDEIEQKKYSFEARLISIKRAKLDDLGSITTITAHGLNAQDFREQFRAKYPGIEDIAIYCYCKNHIKKYATI